MKYILSFLVLIFCAVSCDKDNDDDGGSSAPTGIRVLSQNVLGPGMALEYGYVFDPVAFNVDSAGTNRVWHFTDYDWDSYFTLTYCSPEECPFHTHFPSATRAVEVLYADNPGNIFDVYERVDQQGIWDLGLADAVGYLVFDSAECFLELPYGFGTQWSEVARDSIGDQYYWSVYLDSTVHHCDAWGMLYTPFDTCQALRATVRSTEYYWDSSNPTPQLLSADVEYYWIDGCGDIIVWTSAAESGYINIRWSAEAVSAPASSISSGEDYRRGPDHPAPFAPERRTFAERKPVH